jgi:hypothetical protein
MPGSLEDSVLVERHLFAVVDVDGSDPPWPGGAVPPDEAVWLLPGRVDFRSVGEDHVAAVRFESWEAEPDEPDPGWAQLDDVTVTLSSGTVQLWALTDGPSSRTFTVGRAGSYHLQIFARGTDEVLAAQLEGAEIPDGTERFLLRFMPV